MTTQREIARLAKTSLKTVSRVINKDPLVKEATRKRIEAVIAEVGYTPNQAARMMRLQRSNIIGFLADRVATTASSIELIRGAQDVAHEHGKQMMLFNIERGGQSERDADDQLSEFRAEAIIYATNFHKEITLTPGDIPYVLLNCFEPETRFPTILPDDYQLGYDLTAALLKAGYKKPYFLNLAEELKGAQLRLKGFVDAGAAAGFDLAAKSCTAAAPPENPYDYYVDQILAKVMAGDDRPDILICGQDLMALPVYFELQAMGLVIGRDVAVASFDNIQPLTRLMQPGLSSMDLPYYEMGRAAMLAAIEHADGATLLQKIKGRYVERASTARLSA